MKKVFKMVLVMFMLFATLVFTSGCTSKETTNATDKNRLEEILKRVY